MKLYLLFLLLSTTAIAQTKYQLLDKDTKKPIPYALIETHGFRVNSGNDGMFSLPDSLKQTTFQVDAISYYIDNIVFS